MNHMGLEFLNIAITQLLLEGAYGLLLLAREHTSYSLAIGQSVAVYHLLNGS